MGFQNSGKLAIPAMFHSLRDPLFSSRNQLNHKKEGYRKLLCPYHNGNNHFVVFYVKQNPIPF